jgi:PAT family beta-lactamase induction signal transducer AmpG
LTDAKPTLRQALADKRMMAVLFMSFASGLPYNLTNFSLQAWLASDGLSLKAIGVFTLVQLPYTFKVLWAPILDRYFPPLLTRRRGWIVIFQGLLALAIAAMGFCSPSNTKLALAALAILVAFLSASQDIVVNAYQVDTIPSSERALSAAATAFGYRTAAILGGTLLVIIAAHSSWRLAFMMVALLMVGMMFTTLWANEPVAAAAPPKSLADAVWYPLKDLLSTPSAWAFLLLVLLYKAGDAFALSLYSTFMIKGVGFSLDELSIFGKANMTVSTIIGVALGGWAFLRWGMFRTLLGFGIAQALTNLLYMWLALAGRKVWLLALATCVDTMVGGMGQAAFIAFLMTLCNTNFSATQYAILSAIATFPSKITGAIAAPLVLAIGWPRFFVVTCLTAVPGIVLLIAMRGRMKALAARDAAKA